MAIENAKENIVRAPEEEQLSSTFNIIRAFDKNIRDAVDEFKRLHLDSKTALTEALECTRNSRNFMTL